jgi:hypothetical protein
MLSSPIVSFASLIFIPDFQARAGGIFVDGVTPITVGIFC